MHSMPDFICQMNSLFRRQDTSRDVQPCFVQSERFHLIGIIQINLPDFLGIAHVKGKSGRQHGQFRTFSPCLPKGLSCRNATVLCKLIFCQDNAMPLFRIPANSKWLPLQLRMIKSFYRGIKTVAVAVQDDAIH